MHPKRLIYALEEQMLIFHFVVCVYVELDNFVKNMMKI